MPISDIPVVFAEVGLAETCDDSANLDECLGHGLPKTGNSRAGQPAATSAPATRANVTVNPNDAVQECLSGLSTCALRLRTDSNLVRKVRQENIVAFAKMQQQNAILAQLRRLIVSKLKSSHCQSFRKRRVLERSFGMDMSSGHSTRRHANATQDCTGNSRSKRGSCRYDDDYHSLNGHRLLHIYLDAIDNVQRNFRRLRWVKFRDECIKRSTLPVITFQSDIATPGIGLIGFSDRLLHASYLEDLINRCLVKQNCLLSEIDGTIMVPARSSSRSKTSN